MILLHFQSIKFAKKCANSSISEAPLSEKSKYFSTYGSERVKKVNKETKICTAAGLSGRKSLLCFAVPPTRR